MNRARWTRPEKLLWSAPAFFVLLVGALIYAPRFSRAFEALAETWGFSTSSPRARSICYSNLKQTGLSLFQYSQDWDEKLPLAQTSGTSYGWADALQPYLKSTAIYHCPKNSAIVSNNPAKAGYTDYFYNARLSNQSLSVLNNSAQTILFGEGTSSNARYVKSQLPPRWVSNFDSPARRHFARGSATKSGANYAFADGHVKWFEPQKIGTAPTIPAPTAPSNTSLVFPPTFSLR